MHQATSLKCWKKAIVKQDDDSYYKERIPNDLYFRDINISRFINQLKFPLLYILLTLFT